jgi:uncharacterized protein YbaP (TraB family)
MFTMLQQFYKEQDFEKLVNLEKEFKMTSSSFGMADSTMIANRNINMADRVDDYIQQGKTLFTGVGVLHLPDYNEMRCVVTLLKEKGYNMRPILVKL